MARSITFVAEGDVSTLITITENLDGTLTFDISVTDDSANIGDLRAIFFDLDGVSVDAADFAVWGEHVEDQAFAEEGVDTLGRDANIKGAVSNELGDFDAGVEFGSSGMAQDDIQATAFTLFYDPDGDGVSNLTLDMLDLADFGLRYTSVGEEGGDRTSSAKIGDQSNGVARNDLIEVNEGEAAAINLLSHGQADTNAADVMVTGVRLPGQSDFIAPPPGGFEITDGGAVVALVTVAADGAATVEALGPAADRLGAGDAFTYSFEYQSTASDGSLASAVVTVVVNGVNDAPVADPLAVAGDEDTVISGVLTASDVDGDALTFSLAAGPENGTVVVNPDGGFAYTPFVDFNGADSFTYSVSDGAISVTETVSITVNPVADEPVAVADAFVLDEDASLTLPLLANDSDLGAAPVVAEIDGVAVAAGDVVATAHGRLTVTAGGDVDYTPDEHFSGIDTFSYRVSDGAALSNEATVTLTVTPVADAPVVALVKDGGGDAPDLTPAPSGPDIQVNTETENLQHEPTVTALANGGYAIAWTSRETGANSVQVQIYDADGAVAVPAFAASPASSPTMRPDDIFQLENGELVVMTRGTFGADLGAVFFQRMTTDGVLIGDPAPVSLLPAEVGDGDPQFDRSKFHSQGQALADGGFVATWTEVLFPAGQPAEIRVRASIFDDAGQPIQQDMLIGGPTFAGSMYSSAAALQTGGFAVAWTEGNDVLAQIHDSGGAAVGAAFQVSEWPLHTSGTPGTNSDLVLATLENGDFVVSWTGDEVGDRSNAANFRVYQADGTAVTGQVRANTTTGGEQEDQSVTALADGGFLMTWASFGQDGDGDGLFAQRFDKDGVAVGAEYQVAATTAGSQSIIFGGRYTATLADGRVVTAWDQDGATGEIFYNITTIPVIADGVQDQPLAIDLSASLVDADGSEMLAIVLAGYPDGATFNIGAADGGVWVIAGAETADLSTLAMTPPSGWSGGFTLQATARATEGANGDFAETAASADYFIEAAPQAPIFTVGDDLVSFGHPAAGGVPVVVAGTYPEGGQYDALGGDDEVYLADTLADAAAAGFDPTEVFHGGAGRDFIVGGGLDDLIDGGEDRDNLRGGDGADTIWGGGGSDVVLGGAGDDVMDGGVGDKDVVSWRGSALGVTVDVAAGAATGEGDDQFTNFFRYDTSEFADHVTGSAAAVEQFRLYAGDDVFVGGEGTDVVWAGLGDDTIDGGLGVDRLDYALATAGVTVNLTEGWATGDGEDVISNVEQVFGSQFADVLIGSDTSDGGPSSGFGFGYNGLFGRGGDDLIYGLGGDDDLTEAGDGDDQVYGGDGDDNLGGGAGDDLLDGGDGFDTAYYANTTTGIVVDLAAGVATQGADIDTLVSIERVTGSQGDDVIIGDAGDNELLGHLGDDVLTGGGGADTFRFELRLPAGADRITDFEIGVDVIWLFGGTSSTLADLSPMQVGGDTELTLDNGTILTLEGVAAGSLTDGDFIF